MSVSTVVAVPPSPLRDTVLRSAVEYIAANGPDGLSFRQVAAAAGVSHQAPYHHFQDRKGIFQAIALEGFTLFTAQLKAAAQRDDLDSATAMLQGYVDFALEHKGHFRVMFRSDLAHIDDDPDLAAVAGESYEVLVDEVQRELGPDASADDVRHRVAAMWSLAHGLATLLIDGPLEAELGPVTDRQALVRAVAATSGLASRRTQPRTTGARDR